MQPVKSSNIAAVGYDPATKVLTVEFKNGAKHNYADVPAAKHAALMDADSVGSHFHQHIKGTYESSKVDE